MSSGQQGNVGASVIKYCMFERIVSMLCLCLQVNKEMLEQVLQVYFEALEKIIGYSQSSPEGSEAVEVIYRTVLRHPTIQAYFLSHDRLKKLKKRDDCVHQVVTSRVARLVKHMSQDVCTRLADVLAEYINGRLWPELVRVVESKRSDEASDTLVLEALTAFQLSFDRQVLVRIVGWFLTLPLDVLAESDNDDVGALTVCGQQLMSCLRCLCRQMSSCAVQAPQLSHTAITNLMMLSVHISCDIVNSLLRWWVQIQPLYCCCIASDVFNAYLNRAESVQLDIVATAMAHSAICRRWFVEWCKGAGRKKRKLAKDRAKYIGVLRAFLTSTEYGEY